jgi:D-sedoheptulose 7-phosphate isomerase
MSPFLSNLMLRFPALETCLPDIQRACELLAAAFRSDGKLLICGNGRNASDTDHWAGELLKGFAQPRPLSATPRRGLPSDAEHWQ